MEFSFNVLLVMAALSMVTLNVNGLHDHLKCPELKKILPNSDVICLQETHLTEQQEYAFKLHFQSYNWFFAHGTSNSAGIAVGVHHSVGLIGNLYGEVKGRLLALNFTGTNCFN